MEQQNKKKGPKIKKEKKLKSSLSLRRVTNGQNRKQKLQAENRLSNTPSIISEKEAERVKQLLQGDSFYGRQDKQMEGIMKEFSDIINDCKQICAFACKVQSKRQSYKSNAQQRKSLPEIKEEKQYDPQPQKYQILNKRLLKRSNQQIQSQRLINTHSTNNITPEMVSNLKHKQRQRKQKRVKVRFDRGYLKQIDKILALEQLPRNTRSAYTSNRQIYKNYESVTSTQQTKLKYGSPDPPRRVASTEGTKRVRLDIDKLKQYLQLDERQLIL